MTHERLKQLFETAVPLHLKGDFAAAEAIYNQVLKEHPENPDALHLLGIMARQRGEYHKSVGLIEHAIDINPENADYYANLALVWKALGRYRRSVEASRTHLRLNPKSGGGYRNLADALSELGELEEAVSAYQTSIELEPDSAYTLAKLGAAFSRQGNMDAAVASYRASLRLNPRQPDVHSSLIFVMHRDPNATPEAIFSELESWNQLHGQPHIKPIKPARINAAANRKIRVGWVSPDFSKHVVGRCMLPVFKAFDRSRFENFAYSLVRHPDPMSFTIGQAVDHWQDISLLGDRETADRIRADRIDILIDLALHSSANCLTAFALKPAPVQICYLGYCGSTGLDAMDFRISHPDLEPPGFDITRYREQTLVLPNAYLCYRPREGTPVVGPLPVDSNGFITFGCLSNPSKLTSQTIELWSRLIREVPGSRLILVAHRGAWRQSLLDQLDRAGIATDRVEFLPPQAWTDYMNAYNRIDIALDTVPYGAGITACDALYMGAPIVTMNSDRSVGRLCTHILRKIGRPELSAETADDYVNLAVQLAHDIPRIRALRAELRSALERSPVMDAAGLARDLGVLFKNLAREN